MTPRTFRISPHTQSPHTTLDHLAALTNTRPSGRYLRIPCPAHGGTNLNLSLWVSADGIGAKCHSVGCSYADITAAIADQFGISVSGHHRGDSTRALATNVNQPPKAAPKNQDLRSYALRRWHISTPSAPEHPARRWLETWPDVPEPICMQLVFVPADERSSEGQRYPDSPIYQGTGYNLFPSRPTYPLPAGQDDLDPKEVRRKRKPLQNLQASGRTTAWAGA